MSSDKDLEAIVAFVREHHVMTLATCDEGNAYATPLFFAYDAQRNCFVFASDPHTNHATQMIKTPKVAAGISLETDTVGKIQGLQLQGTVHDADADDHQCYFERFPYAKVMRPRLWRLEPEWMKLTDNRLGFGKKRMWKAPAG